jgi:hypothetical protein
VPRIRRRVNFCQELGVDIQGRFGRDRDSETPKLPLTAIASGA